MADSEAIVTKRLHQNMSLSDMFARFRFEAEALAGLQHPSIAQIHGAGAERLDQHTSSPFFAMELV